MIAEIICSYARTLDYLRQLISDVSDEQLTRHTSLAVNHPAWVVGHLVYSCQAIGSELGIDPWLPSDWAKQFGTGSKPVEGKENYPSKQELLDALSDGQKRVTDRLIALGEQGMSAPLPDERYRMMFPTIGHAVLHILTVHSAIHVGQVTVWRRAVGLGPLSENFS
jgi:hypothetical protein